MNCVVTGGTNRSNTSPVGNNKRCVGILEFTTRVVTTMYTFCSFRETTLPCVIWRGEIKIQKFQNYEKVLKFSNRDTVQKLLT